MPLHGHAQHPHRRPPWRRAGWLAGAGAGLATLVAVAVTAQATRPQDCEPRALPAAPAAMLMPLRPPLAAVPTGTGLRAGVATFYGPDSPGGACMFVERATGGYTAAIGPDQFSAAAACGMTLEVKGRRGTVRVKVTNLCPECPAGHLDLTDEAFGRIDDPAKGRVAISYRVVDDPPLPGPLTVRVKEGSSQWWLALLVDRHGNPLRSVEVSSGGTWTSLTRTDYNHWLAPSGAGKGPFSVRVTDVRGHRVTLPGITLRPGTVQRSTVRMYGAGRAAAPAPTRRTATLKPAAATRTVSATAPTTTARPPVSAPSVTGAVPGSGDPAATRSAVPGPTVGAQRADRSPGCG